MCRHLQRRRSVGRLGEPETYLRELSALDETLGFGGESVIIPNFLLIAANGMVAFSNQLFTLVMSMQTSRRNRSVGWSTCVADDSDVAPQSEP